MRNDYVEMVVFAKITAPFVKGGVCYMTYKQIQAGHEVRMWMKDVIIPVAGAAAIVLSNPDTRQAISQKAFRIKCAIKRKLKK